MNTPSAFKSNPLSAYETRDIQWLWNFRIPYGCVTLLEGDGGVGKSSVVAALGAALSSGAALPDDVAKAPVGVLLLAAEDDPAVVLRPRFERNGAALDIVRCYDQAMLLDKKGMEALEAEVIAHSIKLVVIDPIVSFLGQAIDTSKATDVRSVMGPLHEMARKHSCAIVVVRHWNKSSTATASQKGSGSVDFRNAARSVLQVVKANDQHFLTLEKSNYGATGKTLTFSLDGKLVVWTGSSDLSADEILRERQLGTEDSKSELAEATAFLEEELRAGPVQSAKLQSCARDLGISEATLKRARAKLRIVAKKMPGGGFHSYLPHQLPDSGTHQAQVSHLQGHRIHEPHDPHVGQEEMEYQYENP